MKTNMKTEGVDFRWCLIYLKLTMSPHEIVDAGIQGILPRKLDNKKATILSVEADEDRERWWYPHPVGLITSEETNSLHFSTNVKISL